MLIYFVQLRIIAFNISHKSFTVTIDKCENKLSTKSTGNN